MSATPLDIVGMLIGAAGGAPPAQSSAANVSPVTVINGGASGSAGTIADLLTLANAMPAATPQVYQPPASFVMPPYTGITANAQYPSYARAVTDIGVATQRTPVDLANALQPTATVAGLPLWVWLAGGGLVLVLVLRKGKK